MNTTVIIFSIIIFYFENYIAYTLETFFTERLRNTCIHRVIMLRKHSFAYFHVIHFAEKSMQGKAITACGIKYHYPNRFLLLVSFSLPWAKWQGIQWVLFIPFASQMRHKLGYGQWRIININKKSCLSYYNVIASTLLRII